MRTLVGQATDRHVMMQVASKAGTEYNIFILITRSIPIHFYWGHKLAYYPSH